ncbi:MAG: MerR family transcriptional regulator [Coriobacteriia bacterium]|nr:MerR family transcriptional regulator [Coriobacteriia bacterium]
MYTIKELAKKSGLSRTALLYYESLELLVPDARSESNYRLYSEDTVSRLERICTYRDAGVPLKEIVQILSFEHDAERVVLEKTLSLLNQKAQEVRDSQEKVAALLNQKMLPTFSVSGIDIKSIMDSLAPLGIDESVYLQFHKALEENSPEAHRAFLDFCGFSEEDTARILADIPEKRKAGIEDA